MTTTNVAAEKTASKTREKIGEKLAEKRRALGRGWNLCCRGHGRCDDALPRTGWRSTRVGDFCRVVGGGFGATADGEMVFWLEIDLIDQNPHQTRRNFDEDAIEELADSIRAQGLIQPMVVRPKEEGRFVADSWGAAAAGSRTGRDLSGFRRL